MKLFAKNLMFVLAATTLFSAAAQAGCLGFYESALNKIVKDNHPQAITTGGIGGAAAGVSVGLLYGEKGPAVVTGAGVGAGVATTLAIYKNTDELERMVSVLRDVSIGQGLALNGIYNAVSAKAQVSREQVTKMIKDADDSGALCNGEDLASADELITYLIDLSK